MNKLIPVSLLTCITFLLTACGGSSSSLTTYNSELNSAASEAIDQSIIPAASRFQSQVNELVTTSEMFCQSENTTEENLTALQNQWKTSNQAWFQLLPYRFGPLVNSELFPTYTYIDSYRLRGTNYTSTVRNKIDSLLADNEEINEATFSALSFQFVGLLALEISIFEDAASQSATPADIVSEYLANPRKCQLLTGFSKELLRRADIILVGWNTDYRNTGKSYRDLLVNNQLEVLLDDETGEAAIEKITVSVQEFYDYLGLRDLTLDVSQLSGDIWQTLESSLTNTEELLAGTEATNISFNRIMKNNRFEQTVTLLQDNMQTLQIALDEKNTIDMKAAAKILDGNFKREIPEALDISLGLNFSDGD